MTMTISRKLRHYINPAHIMCFLYRLGLPIRKAQFVSQLYEWAFFNPCIKRFDDEKPTTCPDLVGNSISTNR